MVKTLKFILYVILLAFAFALGVRFSNYFDSKFLKGQTNSLTKHEKEMEETFKNLESPKYNEGNENTSLTDEGGPDVVNIEEVDLIQAPSNNVEDINDVNKDVENKIEDISVNNEQVTQEITKSTEEVTKVNPDGTGVVSTTEVITETTVAPTIDSDKTITNTVVEQK